MTPHLDTEALLALEDGPADASAAAHLAGCELCRAAQRQLQAQRQALRSLPALTPSRPLWSSARARLEAEQRRTRRFRWAGAGFAMAAGLALFLVARPHPVAVRPPVAAQPIGPSLVELQARAAQLESELATTAGPQVLDGRESETLLELEDQIALVDLALTDGTLSDAERLRLWKGRVELLETLVRLRTAEVAMAD